MASPKVVIVCLENRSFDEYFGTFPGAVGFEDTAAGSVFGQTGFVDSGGSAIGTLYPFRTSTFSASGSWIDGLDHGPVAQRQAWAGGAMNAWGPAQKADATTMGYYAANDIPYHWRLAQNFLLCDNYFCSTLGPTWPNRMFLMSGTVFEGAPPAPGSTVSYDMNSDLPLLDDPGSQTFGWPSYPAMLAAESPGTSWKIYDDQDWGPPWLTWGGINPPAYLIPSAGNPWTSAWPLNMLGILQDANGVIGGVGTSADPTHYSHTVPGSAQSSFEVDARAGNLPAISWIVPPGYLTEHPSYPTADGECYLARIVDAVMAGDWENTVLIITYDENDGHFDHVKPPTPLQGVASNEPWVSINGTPGPIGGGFRVPTLIVSPWTVGAGVSSAMTPAGTAFDHTSILQYLEELTGVICSNLPTDSSNNWRRRAFKSLGLLIDTTKPPTPASEVILEDHSVVDGWRADVLTRLWGPNPPLPVGIHEPPFLLPLPSSTPLQAWPPLAQQCYFIMDKTTFGQDEVDAQRTVQHNQTGSGITGPATFASAFWVIVDGFEPAELNLGPLVPPGSAPVMPKVSLTLAGVANAPSGISVNVGSAVPDDAGLPAIPQRFRFPCDLVFNDDTAFSTVTAQAPLSIDVNASITSRLTWNAAQELIELVETADPFIQSGAINYLSTDLRVYRVAAGKQLFGVTLDAGAPDPLLFIQNLIAAFHAPGSTLGADFETDLSTDTEEDAVSTVTLFPRTGGTSGASVYNFAIARITLQGLSEIAENVRVFFRLFPALSTGTAFDPTTLYRSTPLQSEVTDGTNPSGGAVDTVVTPNPNNPNDPANPWLTRVPLLGVSEGDYVTIPFIATARVTPGAAMSLQPPDWPNTQLIKPAPGDTGEPVYAFFGCWLDINQAEGQFPMVPTPGQIDGPFASLSPVPISAFIRNIHQCLVAEVAFDPIPIAAGAAPGVSDRLAQRNLVVIGGS